MTGIKVDVLQMKFGLLKWETSELHIRMYVVIEMIKIPKVKDFATFTVYIRGVRYVMDFDR